MINKALTGVILGTCVLSLNACTNMLGASNANGSSSTVSHGYSQTWTYHGETGPEYWGELAGSETCKIGLEQSPINIATAVVTDDKAPQLNFDTADVTISDNGHTILYSVEGNANTTIINGESYTLKQFHYHTPSEHQLSAINYPAEIHFVHTNESGNHAVIGVMLNPTSHTPMLGDLANASLVASESGQAITVNDVQLNKLISGNINYFNYNGSLTTPPCSEEVQWFVADRPLAISETEIILLTSLYEGNNRPIQPQGERDVMYLK